MMAGGIRRSPRVKLQENVLKGGRKIVMQSESMLETREREKRIRCNYEKKYLIHVKNKSIVVYGGCSC